MKIIKIALICTVFSVAPGLSAAQDNAVSPDQRKAFEGVIRDYLLKNPAIIREAMQALQQREEEEKQAKATRALKEYSAELYHDASSPVGGNPKGDVTIVEFFDYNCGYCKRVAPTISALLKQDPNIRIVYKEFAILGPQSLIAARAALAAQRQGKYHEFHNALMSAAKLDAGSIAALSTRLGLDQDKWLKDMEDPEIARMIRRNSQLANVLGINGTPAFIIGERLIPGAVDLDALTEIVKSERAKRKLEK